MKDEIHANVRTHGHGQPLGEQVIVNQDMDSMFN